MAALLAAGADLEATNDRGNTPLIRMLWGGADRTGGCPTEYTDSLSISRFERMLFLLQAGADPSATKTEAEVEAIKRSGCDAGGCRTAFDFASRYFPEELGQEPDIYNLLLEGHRKAMERIGN